VSDLAIKASTKVMMMGQREEVRKGPAPGVHAVERLAALSKPSAGGGPHARGTGQRISRAALCSEGSQPVSN
jgi:hypothetical protein